MIFCMIFVLLYGFTGLIAAYEKANDTWLCMLFLLCNIWLAAGFIIAEIITNS